MTTLALHPVPETEQDAAHASKLDDRVEYIRTDQSRQRGCHCPSVGVILGLGFEEYIEGGGFRNWRTKILHAVGCSERMGGPTRERRPAGVYPCPECDNVAWTLVPEDWQLPGWRRCDGPRGCGRGWNPKAAVGAQRDSAPVGGQPSRQRTTPAARPRAA